MEVPVSTYHAGRPRSPKTQQLETLHPSNPQTLKGPQTLNPGKTLKPYSLNPQCPGWTHGLKTTWGWVHGVPRILPGFGFMVFRVQGLGFGV